MAPQRGVAGGGGEWDGRSLAAEPAGGGSSGSQGLPKAFLQSLRTLFDILDDRRRGYVHLREIESRWQLQGSEARELPRGVLEGLRRAAPASGYLTFERFVLGLRASLFTSEKGGTSSPPVPAGKAPGRLAAVPPPKGKALLAERGPGRGGGCASRSLEKIPAPQTEQIQCKRAGDACGWQPTDHLHSESISKAVVAEAQRPQRGRGEHRRHTITDGVDYGMLKQMKELEKEKDFLLQGLELVERARAWCHHQIHLLQEHQKQLGKGKAHTDLLAEQCPSPLNHLLPKLQELNRCLCELMSLSAKPPSPYSAPTKGPACAVSSSPQQTIHMLKEQNRLLTKEVTDKSERITQLEQEKSALIKQLFEARAQSNHDTNLLDSTFI